MERLSIDSKRALEGSILSILEASGSGQSVSENVLLSKVRASTDLLSEIQREHLLARSRYLKEKGLLVLDELPGDGGVYHFRCSITAKGVDVVENAESDLIAGPVGDPRTVFVIHGQNAAANKTMFSWLRALDLNPLEWEEAIALTGKSSPYIGEVLDSAFRRAQAVIALLTDDEEVRLRPSLSRGEESEIGYQSRPNVIFEAGMALGRCPERTIIVELGTLRPFSDISGIHVVRLNNTPQQRTALASRLRNAKCATKTDGKSDWLTEGDFEGCVKHDPKP